MIVKNNYNECLTNLACSIKRYFDLEYNHETLEYVDDLLEEKKPKNVVVLLFDGMGSNILKRNLDKDCFFIKNMYKEITTVFPPTTTAATKSIITGLNPVEHGWLGWNLYVKPINKVISLFTECEKGSDEIDKDFQEVKHLLYRDSIVQQINKTGKYQAKSFFPFQTDQAIVYDGLDDMLKKVKEECLLVGKKYIYAYDYEPDSTMHDFGPDSLEARVLIEERNKKVEEFCDDLEDTIVIIIADHGHIKCENIFIDDYPEFVKMLNQTTSLEQRSVSFHVKEEYLDVFADKFQELFGKWFSLYTKDEIIKSKLFGDGVENILFEDALGEYIAIAENSNKCLVSQKDHVMFSHHAGYTDDELFIPLIIVSKEKSKE